MDVFWVVFIILIIIILFLIWRNNQNETFMDINTFNKINSQMNKKINTLNIDNLENVMDINTFNKINSQMNRKINALNIDNLEDVMDIYVINLKLRTDKKENIMEEFKKCGINNPIFFEAIDGRNLNVGELMRKKIHVPEKRTLRRGELGCYFSHMGVWKKFLTSDKKYAFILEDDAILPSDLKFKLDKYLKELENIDWDVIYLTQNCRWFGKECKDKTLMVSENFHTPIEIGDGLYGYIINRKAAKILLVDAVPIKVPADTYVMKHQTNNKNLKFLRINDPIIDVRSTIDSDTYRIK